MLIHIDLFSGIGGFALAAQWAGFKTRVFCEIEPFCREVLKARFGAIEDTTGKRLEGGRDRNERVAQEAMRFLPPDQLNAPSSSPTSEASTAPDSREQPYLPGEFHASRRPLPASAEERRMTVGSGKRLLESWPKSSQPGPSLKTLVESLVLNEAWYSRICYLRWRPKVTKSSRLLFQLAPSMPRTEGTGSGLLLTPATIQIDPSQDRFQKRTEYRKSIGRHWVAGCLQEQIAMLPTPRGADGNKGIRTLEGHRKERERRGQGIDLPTAVGTKSGLKLQPAFVEWMIGFPDGWTDLGRLGTRLSPKSHSKSVKRLPK